MIKTWRRSRSPPGSPGAYHELNPRLSFGVSGFPDGCPFTDIKSYENVASAPRNASGPLLDGPRRSPAPRSRQHTGITLIGVLIALMQREQPQGKGVHVLQEAV